MRLLRLEFLAVLLTVSAACPAQADDSKPVMRTGKERLGPKWSDEQRINNCKVPPDKRGNKPRPSACANAPQS